ncbi:MAG: MMPL family transporter [Acidimicrobiales bacterium]
MRSLPRWCLKHRLAVVCIWLLVFVGAFFMQSLTGSTYASGTKLSGTPSAAAANLLQRAAPSQAGDTERIAFQTKSGTVSAPKVEATIQAMLARVGRLPSVANVVSPYSPAGAKQISANHHIAFATVNFTQDANGIPAAEATQFVNLARGPNSPALQVDVVGPVAASTNPTSTSSTLIGVVAALIVLLIVFGAILPALLPLLGTAIALVAGLSVIGTVSNVVSMPSFTSQLCILIGLGVGIDYALFILTRTRTGLRQGLSVEDAVTGAAATSGRAVFFAGITVCIALLGMLMVGVATLSGAAIAASIAVLFSVASALTLLPALIGLLGMRTLTRRQRAALVDGKHGFTEASRGWAGWASLVQGHRIAFKVGALGVLIALGLPFLSMRQGTADYSVDPTSTTTTTYRGYELLVKGFGPGFSGPLQLVAPIKGQRVTATFATVVSSASHTPGVVTTVGPTYLPSRPGHPAVAVAEVFPTGSPQAASTSQLITHLRTSVIPAAERGDPHLQVLVGGQTAIADDFANQLSAKLPLFVGMVVALSFVLLMIVFRSLLIAATAAVMNLLSAAAAFGVVVAVFQWGWLSSLVGVTNTGPISPFVPILMFAVLFGLSMDYEVFLLSRIQEEWLRRRDNSIAVNLGQAITGRTITAAAAIMTVVFACFIFTTDRTIKMLGLGMATAIVVDALVVRTMLVPAVMHWLGKSNWYLPRLLDRRLPHLSLEDSAERAPESEGEEDDPVREPSLSGAQPARPRAPTMVN